MTKRLQLKQWQWFIVLWLCGFVSLAVVAGLFRSLLLLAKASLH